jgi:D-alanyl-D-alanine carboxypeptidase (penicillin-binding protein 5/6)
VTQHEPYEEYEQHDGISELWAMIPSNDDRTRPIAPTPPEQSDPPRPRRLRRRLIALVATVLVLAVAGTYVSLTLSAPVGAAAAVFHSPTVDKSPAATIALPGYGESAISISGADDYLGPTATGVFASSGGNGALPMASISKLITAMVVLSAKPLGASGTGRTITWDKTDAALYDKYYLLNATIAAMKNGSSMSEHDALETMLVVSACNYAEAMADWAFGSNAGFVSATRKWLKANGLTGTTMVEPTGLDDRNTSTPSDLIALGKLAMANPAVAAMVGKTSLDVPALAGLPSTNDLLGTDGVNGIKTGTLDTEGSDLLYSAVVPIRTGLSLTVIGVVLAGPTRASVDDDVKKTISSIQDGFHDTQLGSQGQVVGSYSTPWGAKASMVLAKDADAFTWSDTPITSTMKTTTPGNGKSGEEVGNVTWVAGKTTETVPVVLKGNIRGPSAWWRLTHPAELLGK